ncbi:sugar ABC transporter permease [Anoxybacter fermentans]|uniref:Maltose/maltodextrin transport system permease protein n=1 Tax=Anoxybacter fermentans TaxID=1323375 RepID=A0A3S9SV80_9FIRM|nr:sugar ABC transporter permease [Anoxybacter fermentans]AZR72216.1 sugar ABC transporter permease [Anoxybacter fermentans]
MSPQVNPVEVSETKTGIRRYIAAILSAIFMGLGQIFNGQIIKGIGFALFYFSALFQGYEFWKYSYWGITTLGEVPGEHHSLVILIKSLVGLILFLMVFGIYIFNIVDAYKNGKLRDQGKQVPGIKKTFKNIVEHGYAFLYLSPGMIFLLLVTVLPLIFTTLIAFTNYDLYHSPPGKLLEWVGFTNFKKIWTFGSWKKTFLTVFSWTIVWTVLSTFSCFGLGLLVALVLNQKDIKGAKIWRTILILPWAVPAVVSILIWSGLFNTNFGPINELLAFFNIERIHWLEDPFWAKVAVLIVNLWLGFPFSMALCTGILQGIPQDVYEAAVVDGANPFQKFWKITLPLVLYSTAPLLIMQMAYNFNNFNVIYLFNQGNPPILGLRGAGGTDILISWVFKLTLNKLKYNYAAALSLIIFIIVAGFSIYNFTRTRSFKEEDMMQ